MTYQNGERKTIVAGDESPEQTDIQVSEDTVKQRLKDLGYA